MWTLAHVLYMMYFNQYIETRTTSIIMIAMQRITKHPPLPLKYEYSHHYTYIYVEQQHITKHIPFPLSFSHHKNINMNWAYTTYQHIPNRIARYLVFFFFLWNHSTKAMTDINVCRKCYHDQNIKANEEASKQASKKKKISRTSETTWLHSFIIYE